MTKKIIIITAQFSLINLIIIIKHDSLFMLSARIHNDGNNEIMEHAHTPTHTHTHTNKRTSTIIAARPNFKQRRLTHKRATSILTVSNDETKIPT